MDNPLHEWDRGNAEDDISFLLAPLLSSYRKNIDTMAHPYGISAGQTPLVVALSKQDGMSQKDLAAVLGVSPPALATMLRRMERSGFIARRRESSDHRVQRVHLTKMGRSAARRIDASIRFINRHNLNGFSGEEKKQFMKYLLRMEGNMKRQGREMRMIVLQERERPKTER